MHFLSANMMGQPFAQCKHVFKHQHQNLKQRIRAPNYVHNLRTVEIVCDGDGQVCRSLARETEGQGAIGGQQAPRGICGQAHALNTIRKLYSV